MHLFLLHTYNCLFFFRARAEQSSIWCYGRRHTCCCEEKDTAAKHYTKLRMGHTIQCLFIGKCAVYMPIFVPYDAPRYIGNEVASDSLNTRLENISHSLSWSIDKTTSEIYKLPNGSYIRAYLSTINCSSATITMTKGFFTFSQELETLP